ncbi:MAG: hypothetical protein FWG02_00645 [Holophagaceae bacterium]|nr:hypothetical protein [Holophagaceae bacterium]
MKNQVPILLIATLLPAYGQERTGAIDPNDVRNFLIQSQLIEYRPQSRRDPFVVASTKSGTAPGDMLIDEITIVGRLIAKNKVFLLVMDNLQNTKQLPVGYRFQDGEITSITETSVVFNQWDPALGSQSGSRSITKVFKNDNQ